jgi:hypothetical protein
LTFGDARLEFPGRTKLEILLLNKNECRKVFLDDIKTKQLQWYGHVQRMEEGRWPKEVMKWRPPRRRKRGRPKLTWTEGIRVLMGEKVLMEEDWNYGNSWRKKIICLLNSLMGAGRCGNIVQPAK